MSSKVRAVLIVVKSDHAAAMEMGREVAAFLRKRGVLCHLIENEKGSEVLSLNMPGLTAGLVPDFVAVLGGDGTLLSVARKLHDKNAPLLGVNMGQVGFLTALTPDDWQRGLSDILEHGVRARERMMLDYEIVRDGEIASQGWFVNDLVVNRGIIARLIRLSASSGDELISSFRADGLIVSTPTGSTAYGVSAGGPLIDASLDVYCVTPICPFLNDFRPLVLPASVPLSIAVDEDAAEVYLTTDGQNIFHLRCGDRINVRQSSRGLTLVGEERTTYLRKLKTKGFFTQR